MDNHTQVVLNEKSFYPLEKILRSIAKCEGSYVISLFDCCREKLQLPAGEASRGGFGSAEEEDIDAEELYRY